MDQSSTIGRAIMGFIAGALSVVTVMTAAWWLTQAAGFIPATAPPFWSMEPPIPPFGSCSRVNCPNYGIDWKPPACKSAASR